MRYRCCTYTEYCRKSPKLATAAQLSPRAGNSARVCAHSRKQNSNELLPCLLLQSHQAYQHQLHKKCIDASNPHLALQDSGLALDTCGRLPFANREDWSETGTHSELTDLDSAMMGLACRPLIATCPCCAAATSGLREGRQLAQRTRPLLGGVQAAWEVFFREGQGPLDW